MNLAPFALFPQIMGVLYYYFLYYFPLLLTALSAEEGRAW